MNVINNEMKSWNAAQQRNATQSWNNIDSCKNCKLKDVGDSDTGCETRFWLNGFGSGRFDDSICNCYTNENQKEFDIIEENMEFV